AQAVFHLERAEADADVLEGLLEACLGLGALDKAERHLATAQALDEDKESPGLREKMAQVSRLLTRRDELGRALKLPEQKKAQANAAIGRFLCADLAYANPATRGETMRLVSASLTAGVPVGPAYALRGLLHLDRGNLKSALADAQKA